ncbi:MAG: protein phosphatase CheZ [Thermodesulfobacteriota bacterium]
MGSEKRSNAASLPVVVHILLTPGQRYSARETGTEISTWQSGSDMQREESMQNEMAGRVDGANNPMVFDVKEMNEKLDAMNLTLHELTDLKDIIVKLKNGEFFEALAAEVSGKIREIAQELVDFRNDIQNKIQPNIVQMVSKEIPEASNQLEGINETLEESTMKIMDINEEQMGLAERQLARLERLLPEVEAGTHDRAVMCGILREQRECLEGIKELSMRMMEPLSFQDLVGQRIQKIIRLVKTMESRIEDIIISFGLKMQRHKQDPGKSFEDLRKEVELYKCDLKGPQRQGDGLGQSQIDELLATL